MREPLLIRKYLTEHDCDILLDIMADPTVPYEPTKEKDSIWKDRVKRPDFSHISLLKHKLITRRFLAAQSHFDIMFNPRIINQVLNMWPTGCEMTPHSDYANGAYPKRDFVSMIYLNDDYEGGELYIPELNFEIKPEKGMLLCFAGGQYRHGVKKVTSGTRYTNSCWLEVVR